MLATLFCNPAKTLLKMNSLILVLFLGATVALAEIHVENDPHHHHHHHHHGENKPTESQATENKATESQATESGKVADEENDPRRPHPSFGPVVVKPSLLHYFLIFLLARFKLNSHLKEIQMGATLNIIK